jgi:hypothetical protein
MTVRRPGAARDPFPGSEREALRSITARPLGEGSRHGPSWLPILVGALAVAGIGYGLLERSRRAGQEGERVALTARADSLRSALAARDSLLAGRPSVEELLAVLAAPGASAFPLIGSTEARGSLIASADGAIVSASGLPRSPDAVYVLWHIDDAGPHRVVDLGTAPSGRLFALLDDAGFATGWGAVQIGQGGDNAAGPAQVILEYRGFLR